MVDGLSSNPAGLVDAAWNSWPDDGSVAPARAAAEIQEIGQSDQQVEGKTTRRRPGSWVMPKKTAAEGMLPFAAVQSRPPGEAGAKPSGGITHQLAVVRSLEPRVGVFVPGSPLLVQQGWILESTEEQGVGLHRANIIGGADGTVYATLVLDVGRCAHVERPAS